MNELTNERLKEIEARCEKATPGEWHAEKIVYKRELDAYFEISGPGKTDESVGYYPRVLAQTIVREIKNEADILAQDYANTAFIAHARQDVPDLLRELRTLREQTRWRDVKDEPPKIGQWVHVVCDGVVQRQAAYLTTADFAPEVGPTEYCWMWADESADTAPFEAVSHWQPLPQEPK